MVQGRRSRRLRAGWGKDDLGHWQVEVANRGSYTITLRFPQLTEEATVGFALGSAAQEQRLAPGATLCVLDDVRLAAGPGRLEAWVARGDKKTGVNYVEVPRKAAP